MLSLAMANKVLKRAVLDAAAVALECVYFAAEEVEATSARMVRS